MTRLPTLLLALATLSCRAPGPVAIEAGPLRGPAPQTNRVYEGVEIVRTVDADTYVIMMPMRVRLYGIDAPELSTERGKKAKVVAEQLVKSAEAVRLRTRSDEHDVYNRLLGVIELKVNGRWESLAELLVKAGWVK